MRKAILSSLSGLALLAAASSAAQAVTVTVDPAAPWQGFMNVFELPANGGGFVFNSVWGTADLVATFSGPVMTITPNTIGDPATFWYVGGGGPGAPGNKDMDANMYVQVDNSPTFSGTSVTFTGKVLSNTLVAPYTSVAFIKDFAPDFSSFNTVTAPLTPGDFSITLNTDPGAGRHVQYGFETRGPNVWITDVAAKGSVQVTAVPEPAMAGGAAVALAGLAGRRRRKD